MLERLQQRDFLISEQARFSPALMAYSRRGLFPPFIEKSQTGLSISDCRGTPFYEFRYPQQGYADFASIPPLVVSSLLFIENRHLLDSDQPLANPAVDWPRFTMAALSQIGKLLDVQDQSAGGSTLATQLEKYRHSPDGLTLSAKEKLRQMISASVRAYQQGPQTLEARQTIVRDYLNSVPLSAAQDMARSMAWLTACASGTARISSAAMRCSTQPARPTPAWLSVAWLCARCCH